MRRRVAPGLFATLAAGASAAAQPPPTVPIDNPVYVCIATRSDPNGTLIMGIRINNQPRRFDSLMRWTSARSSGGVSLAFLQGHLDLDAYSTISLSVEGQWRGNPRVRVVLSKSGVGRDRPWDVVFSSGYQRYLSGRAEVTVTLNELRAFAGGAPVTVSVMRRNGAQVAQATLEPDAIDAAIAAVATVRPEIEAMAADYRNRCVQRPASEGLRI